MATLVSSKTEYRFTHQDILQLLATDLGLNAADISVSFFANEAAVDSLKAKIDWTKRTEITATVTVDHTKNGSKPGPILS